jgi:hypothetical protein
MHPAVPLVAPHDAYPGVVVEFLVDLDGGARLQHLQHPAADAVRHIADVGVDGDGGRAAAGMGLEQARPRHDQCDHDPAEEEHEESFHGVPPLVDDPPDGGGCRLRSTVL